MFLLVGKTVAVQITVCVVDIRVESFRHFVGIRHAVVVGVFGVAEGAEEFELTQLKARSVGEQC